MSEAVSTGEITPAQKKLIEKGVIAGLSFEAIRARVRELGHVGNDDLRDEVDGISQALELRRQFKKEGVRLMREFVGRVKNGSDVEDMAAMIEISIYRDLLRRYTEDEKTLERIPTEQLLKLDVRYRMARIACQRELVNGKGADAAKKLAARLLPKIVNKLVSFADERMAEQIKALIPQTMEWAKAELGRENIEEMENEGNELERLNALLADDGSGCLDQREAGREKATGLVV
ncbi:MAG: hypothetical protein HQK86_07635 [Nitrospinae bacterium]|nr:hypothetical protein [Nitrospinota bacterium]